MLLSFLRSVRCEPHQFYIGRSFLEAFYRPSILMGEKKRKKKYRWNKTPTTLLFRRELTFWILLHHLVAMSYWYTLFLVHDWFACFHLLQSAAFSRKTLRLVLFNSQKLRFVVVVAWNKRGRVILFYIFFAISYLCHFFYNFFIFAVYLFIFL